MRRALAGMIAWTVVATAGKAGAQPKDDLARADSMFNAGKALVDAGQYADACAKFAESKRLAPGLGVTLYLADCYEHVGRTASAWTEFRSAEGLARERHDKRADVARARAEAIEPKLNRLVVTVSPSVPRSSLEVLRDGLPVAQDELGAPVPVDPGDHVVVVSSPGHRTRSFQAHVGPEHQTVTVQVDRIDEGPTEAPTTTVQGATASAAIAPAATPPNTLATTPPAPPNASGGGGAARRWIGVGVGALGVVGVGVGSALGLAAASKRDQSNGGPCDVTDRCSGAGLSLRQDALRDATGATIAFIVGGVALATGAVLYFTAPAGVAALGIVVAPAPMAGGGGAIVRARF
jgi:hypothetical protein